MHPFFVTDWKLCLVKHNVGNGGPNTGERWGNSQSDDEGKLQDNGTRESPSPKSKRTELYCWGWGIKRNQERQKKHLYASLSHIWTTKQDLSSIPENWEEWLRPFSLPKEPTASLIPREGSDGWWLVMLMSLQRGLSNGLPCSQLQRRLALEVLRTGVRAQQKIYGYRSKSCSPIPFIYQCWYFISISVLLLHSKGTHSRLNVCMPPKIHMFKS